MSVKVTIELNNSNISKLIEAQKQAIEMTMEAVLSDIKTSAVTPKHTGELERSGFVDTSQLEKFIVSIVYDTPYARRLYWHPEYNFCQNKNKNAQGLWMQSYLDEEKKDFIKDTYIKFFKQLSKGVVK
jgi:hypothetical protein